MLPFNMTSALASEQIRDRVRGAQQSRLAALARCCRPRTLRPAAHRAVVELANRLHRRARTAAASPAGCCA
jgi:hypothetical protein